MKKIFVDYCFGNMSWPDQQEALASIKEIKSQLSEFYDVVEDVSKADYVLALCNHVSPVLKKRIIVALQNKLPVLAMAHTDIDVHKFIYGVNSFVPRGNLHFIPYESPDGIFETTVGVMESLELAAA